MSLFITYTTNGSCGPESASGEGKNSIGSGEAKELICMTHGHELRWGNAVGGVVQNRGE